MNDIKLFFMAVTPIALIVYLGIIDVNEEILFFAFLIWSVVVVGLYFLSDRIVIKLCRGELLTVYHSPTIFRSVEELCTQAELPVPKIFMIPEDAPNICSVGRNPRNSAILFTEGMLKDLTHEELRCAIAHELVHIYRRETQIAVIATLLASLTGLSSERARRRLFALSPNAGQRSIFMSGPLVWLSVLAGFLVQLLVKPKRELRADEYAAKLTQMPLQMANTIRTMEKRKHSSPMQVVPTVSHLFLVNPIHANRIERLFVAHPPMDLRIRRLEAMQTPIDSRAVVVSG